MCIGSSGKIIRVAMAPVVPTGPASAPAVLQIAKPKLPRKITRTPRIDLNKYWSAFEDLMTAEKSRYEDTAPNNEINDNISNEMKESSEESLVRRNNQRNWTGRCCCHFCLISDLRNVTVSERNEEVTEL